VLEALVTHGPIGVSELADVLGLDRSIVHRLLTTLQAMGYATQDDNRKYMAGKQIRLVGAQAIARLDLRSIARPYMQALIEQDEGASHLAKLMDGRVIYIERVQHPALTITTTGVGGEAPAHCTVAGKVLWAYAPYTQLSDALAGMRFQPFTPHTITEKDTFQRHLAEVREHGFATEMEEHRLGLIGIGAPVFDHTGSVIAAMCTGILASRTTEDTLTTTRQMVTQAARSISEELGYST
jgi:IclR family acetate operon transcriptional repressor